MHSRLRNCAAPGVREPRFPVPRASLCAVHGGRQSLTESLAHELELPGFRSIIKRVWELRRRAIWQGRQSQEKK